MKTTGFKLFFFLVFPAILLAGNPQKHTETKKINREFKVSAASLLSISNSYGNIELSTWSENRVIIEVNIKVVGSDQEEVKRRINDISIKFNQSAGELSATTHFEKKEQSWWKKLFDGSSNTNMEVNYSIKAPATNSIDFNNNYGAIYIDQLLGNAKISCDYGKFDIGELQGGSNLLNFDYTRNGHIGYAKNVQINADYSDFTLEEAENVDLNSDYTQSNFLKVANLHFNCDYGGLKVEKVKNIEGNGDYLSTKIDRLFSNLDLKLDYGSLSVEEILESAGNIAVRSNYTGLSLGYEPNLAFSFQLETSFGDITTEDLEVQKKHQSGSKKSVQGYHLSENNSCNFKINANYGNIKLKEVNK